MKVKEAFVTAISEINNLAVERVNEERAKKQKQIAHLKELLMREKFELVTPSGKSLEDIPDYLQKYNKKLCEVVDKVFEE